MIVNKNDLTKLARVLVTYLGYMSIAFGLALPAYGDSGRTSPLDCAAVSVPNKGPYTGVVDVGDPSSFAAGCNAKAETDGSIAIGEGASVEAYEVTEDGMEGQATHNYDPDGDGVGLARAVVVLDGGIYEVGADGALGALIGEIGEKMFEDANAAYTLRKRTADDEADAIVMEGAYGIAIGTEANILGRESIAIGARASAGRIDFRAGEKGDATHNYDPDGDGVGLARAVVVLDGGIYEVGADGALGALIGEIGEKMFEDANAAYTLRKRTEADEADETEEKEVIRAVAIGADSSVTGDSGVALGAGAMAGTNSVSLGQGVTAGVNQIRIGGTGTANVEIGGYNIGSMDSAIGNMNTIVGNNSDNIGNNSDNIGNNSDNIATNSADIATNSADIATNSAGIAMSIAFAHLPSVSAGDKGSWGIGAGSFAGKTALAVGISYRVQTNGVIKAGVSSSGGETSFGVGFGKGF